MYRSYANLLDPLGAVADAILIRAKRSRVTAKERAIIVIFQMACLYLLVGKTFGMVKWEELSYSTCEHQLTEFFFGIDGAKYSPPL